MGNRSLITSHAPGRHILYVAYPLLPVSDESCGGAEQMLAVLEAEMAARGHQTTIAACAGSRASGAVFPTGKESSDPDRLAERNAEHEHRILQLLEIRSLSKPFDLIHDKSGSFWRRAKSVNVPILATLHLPRHFYPSDLFHYVPENVHFNCVSETQAASFSDIPNLAGVIRNGIRLADSSFCSKKDDYVLWMGRICEEKGPHIAIEVAQRTGLPLVLAGQVYPFSYHQRYYNEKIRPHLGKKHPKISFFETPTLERKTELLAGARALLVPSLVDETSSLVSMEAMACGTPVIAFRRGAIPEVVEHNKTGFVVDDVAAMVSAVRQSPEIDPHACRLQVEENFTAARMAKDYERLYDRIVHAKEQSQAA